MFYYSLKCRGKRAGMVMIPIVLNEGLLFLAAPSQDTRFILP